MKWELYEVNNRRKKEYRVLRPSCACPSNLGPTKFPWVRVCAWAWLLVFAQALPALLPLPRALLCFRVRELLHIRSVCAVALCRYSFLSALLLPVSWSFISIPLTPRSRRTPIDQTNTTALVTVRKHVIVISY